MPYRHAHWYLLTLFPLVGLAFWPGYFSKIERVPMAFHAHAVTGATWIGILFLQSWMIHHGRRDIHRKIGLASLALFSLFMASGAAVAVQMSQDFVSRVSPAEQIFDPKIALADAVWVSGFAYCYYRALRQRRKVHPHSRYILSTVLFLLPPILGRLFGYVPSFHVGGPQDFWKFGLELHLSNAIATGIALFFAWRAPKYGRPLVEAALFIVVSSILFQTVGGMPSWHRIFGHLASIPEPAFAFVAGVAGIAIAYAGWIAGRRPTASVKMVPA